jgi:hypothetical protein
MQLSSNVIKKHKFRFLASSALANVDITTLHVLGVAGGLGTVANSTITLFNKSFKISKVEMWAPPPSQGSTATVSLEWLGSGVNSPNREVSDTSMSTAFPAHLVTKPPAQSLASFWTTVNAGSATNIFRLNCPAGTVVDLSLQLIENDQELANVTVTVVTAVLGNIYYLYLDGVTTHLLTPVSLNTTF